MGQLIYGGSIAYEIDDRALAHLKPVIAAKLRRHEGFLLSWIVEPEAGSGRISLWIAPAIPLAFRFSGSRAPELNPVWLEVLAESANSARGMQLTTEAEADALSAARADARRSAS